MTKKARHIQRRWLLLAATMVCLSPATAQTDGLATPSRTAAPTSATTLSVHGGSAPIEKAITTIIPTVYGIQLESNVPSTLVLVWKDGDNWREVLNAALAPIGLVATPDWASNSISIGWQKPVGTDNMASVAKKSTGPERKGNASGSDNAPPAPRSIQSDADEGQRRQMVGTFEVDSVQESSGTITPAKDPLIAQEEEKDRLIVGGDEIIREIKILKTDRHSLPSKEDLWELMKAAVGGATITLTGYSGSLTEPMRVKWANNFAYRLKARLENIGFPADLVKVKERSEYKSVSDKPHVEIKLTRKAV